MTFAALEKRCATLLGAPTQVTVSGLCNAQMNGVYVLDVLVKPPLAKRFDRQA